MSLHHFSSSELLEKTATRIGEKKVGEVISICSENWKEELQNSNAKMVLFGIAEDIGVRANLGRKGARNGFQSFINTFVNVQVNSFLPLDKVMLLGVYQPFTLLNESDKLNQENEKDLNQLRSSVNEIDAEIKSIIQTIVSTGKIPVIVGGGHNNAFPIIAGTSLAKNKPVHVINCDPHSDFRATEGRHSGNGFRYAFENGALAKYSVVGLHEGYNNQENLDAMRQHSERVSYHTFENVFVRSSESWKEQITKGLNFLSSTNPLGIELDLDSISGMPVSAATPSGLRLEEARQYLYQGATKNNCTYIHLCEAAPELHIHGELISGKALSYLVQDAIKAVCSK